MTQAALLPFHGTLTEASTPREATTSLSSLAAGDTASVVELTLEPEMAGWLRAVGIGESERVTVLRRAAFGGPIHVRTSSGGEFALHRALAASVLIRRIVPSREPPP
jgi:Fe2+ transport system protein FeoA